MTLRDYDSLSDRVRMHVRASDECFIIVEGPDDELVLKHHLRNVQFFPAAGKPNAIVAARELLRLGISDFACVTDADFDDLSTYADIEDVHYPYEGADLEAMLIGFGVLSLVLEHQGSTVKLEALGGAGSFVDDLVRRTSPISRLRAESARNHWGIAFDRVDLQRYLRQDTLELKVPEYCLALHRESLAAVRESDGDEDPIPHPDVIRESCKDSGAAPGAVSFRGKDVIVFASTALRRMAGSLRQGAADPEVLRKQLHSSSGLAISQSIWLVNLKELLGISPTA